MMFAGLAGFACSQQAREPVEVGTVQEELRSDLVFPEERNSSTGLPAEEYSDSAGQFAKSAPATQHIVAPGMRNPSQNRAYRAVKRYELLPALLDKSDAQKVSAKEGNAHASSWTFAEKSRVRGGKGFGVAAEAAALTKTVHLDDASYYSPAIALKPYSKASEHPAPVVEPFKSQKPHVFHHGATGFAHELPAEARSSAPSQSLDAQEPLSPIHETRVYLSSKPRSQVNLAPSKNRLDLINGNENLNRHRFYKLR